MYRILKKKDDLIVDYGLHSGESFQEACEFLVYQWGVECDGFYNKDENSFYGDKFIDGEVYYRQKLDQYPEELVEAFIKMFVLNKGELDSVYQMLKIVWIHSRLNTLDDIGIDFFDRIPYKYIHEMQKLKEELDVNN